jgi:O-antigen/teichoic acid export membrane protein
LLLGLISAPLLTRHLGVVEFGRYMTVFSLVTLVALLTDGGLGALGVRELAVLGGADRRAFMRNLIGIRALLLAVGVLGAVVFAALAGYGSTLVVGTLAAGAGACTYAAQGVASLPLAAELRLGWVTAAEVLRQVVFVATLAGGVLLGAGVVALLAATIPAGLAGTLLLVWVLRSRADWRPAFDVAAWRAILRHALPIGLAGAIYSTYFRLVILVMSVIAAATQTGYFALSFRVIEVLVGVPFLLTGSLIPIFTRAGRGDDARLSFAFSRTFDVAILGGVGLTLVTFAGAPFAMWLLTGDAHGPAVEILRIQSFTLVAVFVNSAYGAVLISLHRHRDLVLVGTLTLLVTLVAAAILVPLADARGGAFATVLGEWSLTVGVLIVLARVRPNLRPQPSVVLKAALASAVAGVAAAFVEIPRFPNLAPPLIAGVVYALALVAMRGVPSELTDALLRRRSAAS